MATGDNGLTAISVGRKCGIIDSTKPVYLADAMTGNDKQRHLKWLKIDVSLPVDQFLSNIQYNTAIANNSYLDRKESIRRLSLVSGYEESKKGNY